MKRFAAALSVVALLLGSVYVVFFTASKYRMEDQGYFLSLFDFNFMLHSFNREVFSLSAPPLTDRSYESVMAHARRTAHREVQRRVVWCLTRWGDDVAPRLIREIEVPGRRGRVVAAARALSELEHVAALAALGSLLERTRDDRWLQVQLVDAVGRLGPSAAPLLLDTYRFYESRNEPQPYTLLDALGETGGATEFLIAELKQATTTERVLELEWPLALTRDPRAARVLVGLLHHPELAVRRRARDSMAQSMGEVAIEPVVELLERETDDYLRNWLLNFILASPDAARSERALTLIASLIEDPAVSWNARYALARTRSDRAVELFMAGAERYPPGWFPEHLDNFGVWGLPIIDYMLESNNLFLRREATRALAELGSAATVPLLEKALRDSDAHIRREAAEALERADVHALGMSASEWLSARTGRVVGPARLPDRKGVRVALRCLRFVHWLGLGVSLIVGLLLLTGALRAFEPFKFALALQFLLVEGLVGDFFFVTSSIAYRWATAGRLVLLLGLLFLRDDPLPGETRGRIERLAVRSLWILVPLLLLVGAPIFADALRLSLRDFTFMKWAFLLLALTTVFILEQVFVPWNVFPRGGRIERAMTFVLSLAVVLLVALPLYRYALASPDDDRRAVAAWLLLPLALALVFHLRESRLFARTLGRRSPPSPVPGRLALVDDGDTVLVKLRRKRRWKGLPLAGFSVAFLGGAWVLLDSFDITAGGGPALFLMLTLAVMGPALAMLVLTGLSSSFTIQVRDGAMRWATTFLGGALGRSRWYRKLRLPTHRGFLGLSAAESRFIAKLLMIPLLLCLTVDARARLEVEHPSDYVRVLEGEHPHLWDEAIVGLLDDDEDLPMEAVSSVIRRSDAVSPGTRVAVARALSREGWHPRTLATLWAWAHAPDETLRSEAMESLLSLRGNGAIDAFRDLIEAGAPERLEALRSLVKTYVHWKGLRDSPYRDVMLDPVFDPANGTPEEIFDRRYLPAAAMLLRSGDPDEREAAARILSSLDTVGLRSLAPELFSDGGDPDSEASGEVEEPTAGVGWRALVLAGLAWVAALGGTVLFVWGFRLGALAVRIRYRPIAKARTVALGPVALEGTVEAAGASLAHPITGEACVYYVGADRDHPEARFYLQDETGRVLVDARNAVIFSDDGVLVSGERVHIVGLACRDTGGEVVLRKDETPPSLFHRLVRGTISLLFGFGRETSVTKMLFSDPQRCFWIWDDLEKRPMTSGAEVAWLAVGIALAGAWMIVFALAAGGLLDADLASANSMFS